MMDSKSVITVATKGIVEKMARENEITPQAQYAALGPACVYPKARKLIRQISRLNPDGGRMIQQDLDALFAEELDGMDTAATTCSDFHRELSEAVQAKLTDDCPRDEKLRELRQAAAIIAREIRSIQHEDE